MGELTTTAAPKPSDQVATPMTEDQARRAVESFRANLMFAAGSLLSLYEGSGHIALGYSSWREMAVAEFGVSQSRAYQLLDWAKSMMAIGSAAGSTDVEITEAASRAIKPFLGSVCKDIAERVESGEDPGLVHIEVVAEARDLISQIDLTRGHKNEHVRAIANRAYEHGDLSDAHADAEAACKIWNATRHGNAGPAPWALDFLREWAEEDVPVGQGPARLERFYDVDMLARQSRVAEQRADLDAAASARSDSTPPTPEPQVPEMNTVRAPGPGPDPEVVTPDEVTQAEPDEPTPRASRPEPRDRAPRRTTTPRRRGELERERLETVAAANRVCSVLADWPATAGARMTDGIEPWLEGMSPDDEARLLAAAEVALAHINDIRVTILQRGRVGGSA